MQRKTVIRALALLLSLPPALGANAESYPGNPNAAAAFVHLFEWTWPDIARECETFLGPAGYSAVQISPPQEHVTGDQWWTRYQPVSYRLESRGGTRKQLENMVSRCRAAGVAVYADAVINHMSDIGEGIGVAGSAYRRFEYPVPYDYDDFHHCGRHGDEAIGDYQDAWEVRNCQLGKLADLDTGDDTVQRKIAAYLADLLDTGVSGFRIDAAKHMEPGEIEAVLRQLPGHPFVYQEVIDRGTEPITSGQYAGNGSVTEFKYGMQLYRAFTGGDLSGLQSLGSEKGWAPSEKAVVFIDNHDVQRGHAGGDDVLTHRDHDVYLLANIYMLAWPYGYPMVMSSYRIRDSDHGPPSAHPINQQGLCDTDWVCEHRDPAIAAMVEFRRQTQTQPTTAWTQINPSAIAFSRGNRGFLAINAGKTAVTARVPVDLPPGRYGDVLTVVPGADNSRNELIVDEEQTVTISLPPMSATATHVGALK